MSVDYEEFERKIKYSRFQKKINDYLKYTANNIKRFPFLNSNSNSNSGFKNCDDIITGKWIDPPVTFEKIEQFRKELVNEIFPIMNALIRSAVEEYGKKVESNSLIVFINNNQAVIDKYKMRYDKDLDDELDVLNINRFLRNHYLHYHLNRSDKWITTKSYKDILKTKIFISLGANSIIFLENGKEVCKILESEQEYFSSCPSLRMAFVEFLAWRIKNLIKEIDSARI